MLADGSFIANWTLRPATRRAADGSQTTVVASIAASCSNGAQLPAVAAPQTSANFSLSLGAVVIVSNDADASKYQYWRLPGQQDLTSANAAGFRAVWIS